MKYIKLDPQKIRQTELKLITDSLLSGQIVFLPSDTVYGLSVRADESRVIKKLRRFKGRDDDKPLLILVSSFRMLKQYFLISREQESYLRKIWNQKSRPSTIILKDRGLLPSDLNQRRDGLAVRLPKSEFLIKIITASGVPLVSTSANLSGQEPIKNPQDIKSALGQKKPQLIIDGGKCLKTRASRLLDLREYPQIKILRK